MNARAVAALTAVVTVIGLLAFGLVSAGGAGLAPGDRAPDTKLPRLGGEGTGSLAEHQGKWVLVNFWASWCDPCREESPALQRFYERHRGERFTVVGISAQDLTDDALRFVEQFELTYPMLRDAEGERFDDFAITGLPESFLVDPKGRIALVCRGPVDGGELEGLVAPLIEGREITTTKDESICAGPT